MTVEQIFYTHVMKTGGQSLSSAISAQFPANLVFPSEHSGVWQVSAKTIADRLLELDEHERRRYRFITVHHPAWVAFTAAPGAFKVTVLREPVARTVSHLRQIASAGNTPDDLEEIYAERSWRDRLCNYQTQLFSDIGTQRAVRQTDVKPFEEDEHASAALTAGLRQVWATAIARPISVDSSSLDLAIATLERYDCVGITEDLASVVERVSERTGLVLPAVAHLNRAKEALPVSPELLDHIVDDNKFDHLLHAAAEELSRS